MAKTLASVWASVHDPGGTRPTQAPEIVEAGSREVVALAWPFRDVRQEIPPWPRPSVAFRPGFALTFQGNRAA